MLFSVFVQSVFVFHGFPPFPKVVASLLSAVKTSMNYDFARRTLHLMKFTNRARLRRLIVKTMPPCLLLTMKVKFCSLALE